jgi:hypothetical protein
MSDIEMAAAAFPHVARPCDLDRCARFHIAALVQIALMPIALGCLMCFFAALWFGIRG